MSPSKKPPEYVRCAKCGYRGVDRNHECTRARAAAQAAARDHEAAARQALDNMFAAEEAPLSFPTRLLRLAGEHARLLGRRLTYEHVDNRQFPGLVVIRQRCAVCCSDIEKNTSVDVNDGLLGVQLHATARKAYLMHRCPPVSASLLGFTYEELEELHVSLDRDLQAIAERVLEIEKLKKARPT